MSNTATPVAPSKPATVTENHIHVQSQSDDYELVPIRDEKTGLIQRIRKVFLRGGNKPDHATLMKVIDQQYESFPALMLVNSAYLIETIKTVAGVCSGTAAESKTVAESSRPIHCVALLPPGCADVAESFFRELKQK